jgi:hypothetical protein
MSATSSPAISALLRTNSPKTLADLDGSTFETPSRLVFGLEAHEELASGSR